MEVELRGLTGGVGSGSSSSEPEANRKGLDLWELLDLWEPVLEWLRAGFMDVDEEEAVVTVGFWDCRVRVIELDWRAGGGNGD
jgi:hypothetical protein